MSDYTRGYDGAAKDTAEATLSGADFDSEFDIIQTAVNSKADKVGSPTLDNILAMDVNGNLKDSTLTTTEIVTLADAQTLTNKALTDPTIAVGSDDVDALVLLPLASWTSHSPGTVNGTWYTIASAAIPNGASWAIIKVSASGTIASATTSTTQIEARKTGGAYSANTLQTILTKSIIQTNSAATHSHNPIVGYAMVEVDANGDFDVRGNGFSSTMTGLDVFVIGYAKSLA